MWGINYGQTDRRWQGVPNFTLYTPTKAARLPPQEQWKIWTFRFSRNNISKVVGNSGFPCDIFKGINRTILSKIT